MKQLLIIPYGTPHWNPFSTEVKEISYPNLDIAYLLPLWGIVMQRDLSRYIDILQTVQGIPEHQMSRDTAVSIRTWLHLNGKKYPRIVILKYGPLMPFWSKGAAGTPYMNNVKIVRFVPNAKKFIFERVRRALGEK